MMDPTREPWSMAAEPTAPHDILPDDAAVVTYLRARAPGLPTPQFDARAITSRARGALRRRRRRLRYSVVAAAGAATAYLALALAGPLPVPGVGTVTAPGGDALQALVRDLVPGGVPEPDQWPADVARLETEVVPVVEELELTYYFMEEGHPLEDGRRCVLEYSRGDYTEPECGEQTPFDAEARADFDEVTAAIDRSGVAVERIMRQRGGIYVAIPEGSWQYDWYYVYLPDVDSPPVRGLPDEEWTHITGDWWFHRVYDD